MKVSKITLASVVTLLYSSSLSATPVVAANWTTTSTGTLNDISFAVTGLGTAFSSQFVPSLGIQSSNSPDFAATPVGTFEIVAYFTEDNWSVTFDSPVTDLFLLFGFWRGFIGTEHPDTLLTYTFSRPFVIASGLSGASVSGNSITLPGLGIINGQLAGFVYNGVILFPGEISTLSVIAPTLPDDIPWQQNLSFAVDAGPGVPEPSTVLLMAIGFVALVIWASCGVPT